MLERTAKLKKRMQAGEASFGAWLTMPGLNIAEIMAGIGFDWVFIDAEHGPFDAGSLQISLAAFNGSPTVPIVRVAANDAVQIGQALDLGAEGIIIPQVEDADAARRAVAAGLYPPLGSRSFGPRRASNYYRDIDAYVSAANDSLLTIVQIESLNGVKEIDSILEVAGIDAVFTGPMDLSGSAGVLRNTGHPVVTAAIEAVLAKCHAKNMPTCAGMSTPVRARQTGARLILTGDDAAILRMSTLQSLHAFRTEFEKLT